MTDAAPAPRRRRTRAVDPSRASEVPVAVEAGPDDEATSAPTWWWTAAGSVVTLVWLVGAVLTDALPVDIATVSAVAAVAVAALVTASWAPASATVEAILASGTALVVLPTLTAVGLDGFATDPSPALPLLLVGLVLLAAATVPIAPRQARVLAAPGLLLAVPAAVDLDATTAIVLVAGTAAVAAAWWWWGAAAVPLGLLAVAVTAVPGGTPAAYLLASAAVLAAAAPPLGGVATVLGLPGAVVAAAAIAAGPISVVRVAATVAFVGVAVLATVRAPGAERPVAVPSLAPTAALALWLLLLPGTWTWVGDARLDHYDQGAVRATAGAAVALVAREAWLRRRGPVPSTDELP